MFCYSLKGRKRNACTYATATVYPKECYKLLLKEGHKPGRMSMPILTTLPAAASVARSFLPRSECHAELHKHQQLPCPSLKLQPLPVIFSVFMYRSLQAEAPLTNPRLPTCQLGLDDEASDLLTHTPSLPHQRVPPLFQHMDRGALWLKFPSLSHGYQLFALVLK